MRKCKWTVRENTIFGYFHEFGLNVGFNADGYGVNYTEAIVEDTKGNLDFAPVESIQFLPDDYQNEAYENSTLESENENDYDYER